MRNSVILLGAFLMLTSCSTTGRIIEIGGGRSGIKGFRLDQKPKAILTESLKAEDVGTLSVPFTSRFIFEEDLKNRPRVLADFRLQAPIGAGELDSVVFFNLDGEKIRMVARNGNLSQEQPYSSGNQTNRVHRAEPALQAASRENDRPKWANLQLIVPENLWVSVAYAQKIGYRLFTGKEGMDVILNSAETGKLKEFFVQACARRDAAFPAIPEGLKKW